ncbi:MAG: radical SAM protein [Bdellovibrionota bacterium]
MQDSLPTPNKERLRITEIFHSIQGESTLAGERFSFVRLTGCPLRCTYCDTTYSYTGGKWMTHDEIIAEVESHETTWVLITGGEPLAQKNTINLVEKLKQRKKEVSIETDGEEDVAPYAGKAKLIMDIKTPSSGEKAELCFANIPHLLPTDEVKFVIGDRSDYEWAKKVCAEYRLIQRLTVLFSPVHDALSLRDLAEWIVRDRLNVRLQTQLHKHIWPEATRGY